VVYLLYSIVAFCSILLALVKTLSMIRKDAESYAMPSFIGNFILPKEMAQIWNESFKEWIGKFS
jgi:hypothetical protein